MTPTRINAPFNDEQVRRLKYWQTDGVFHPYTCPEPHDESQDPRARVLLVNHEGLYCRTCDYRQTWVHAFSTGDD